VFWKVARNSAKVYTEPHQLASVGKNMDSPGTLRRKAAQLHERATRSASAEDANKLHERAANWKCGPMILKRIETCP